MIEEPEIKKDEKGKEEAQPSKKLDGRDFDLDKFFKETDKIGEIIKKKEEKDGNRG